jgi:hypothetical protein
MRKAFTILAIASFMAAMMPSALAGNMAVTAFDSLPDEFEAGHTYTLSYTILQHGVNPVDVGESVLSFTNLESGEILTFEAVATGDPGRYSVEVTLPTEGSWHWKITQGPFEPHDLGILGVVPSSAAAGGDPAWFDVLQVILPVTAIAAAWYTVREVARSRSGVSETSPEAS